MANLSFRDEAALAIFREVLRDKYPSRVELEEDVFIPADKISTEWEKWKKLHSEPQ